jgi:hypothetical protein
LLEKNFPSCSVCIRSWWDTIGWLFNYHWTGICSNSYDKKNFKTKFSFSTNDISFNGSINLIVVDLTVNDVEHFFDEGWSITHVYVPASFESRFFIVNNYVSVHFENQLMVEYDYLLLKVYYLSTIWL